MNTTNVVRLTTRPECPIARTFCEYQIGSYGAPLGRSGVPRPYRRFLADHLVAKPSPEFVNCVAVAAREKYPYAITLRFDYPLAIRTVDVLLKHASNLTREIPVPAEPLVGGFHEHILAGPAPRGERRAAVLYHS